MKKKVFIHVGPPKTGTSAVQNWFSKNSDILRNKGLYYPHHTLDPNGVSSGNLNSVCDIKPPSKVGKPAQITVSKHKVQKLLAEFNNSSCQLLFLSSEFFIQHMESLKALIPEAYFIAYLRNPIEILESNYNQGVKRAGFSHTINLANFKTIPHVNYLLDYTDNHPRDSLLLRFYEVSFSGEISLIDDILAALGIEGFKVAKRSVNNSYHFEALEVKRWLNNFNLGALENKVDYALQSFNLGQAKFSLIPPDKYQEIKNNYKILIRELFQKLRLDQSFHEFYQAFSEQSQSPFKEQKLKKEEFLSVVSFLKKALKKDFELLNHIVKQHPSVNSNQYFMWFEEESGKNKGSTLGKFKDRWLGTNLKKKIQIDRKSDSDANLSELVGLDKLRKITKVPPHIEDADLLRELALFLESNGQLNFAIVLLQKAAELRPHGKFIIAKLEELNAKTK